MGSPFGVELPENVGEHTPSAEPTEAPSGEPSSPKATEPEATQKVSDLVDLDKLERFRFGGREWSRKDFTGGYLRHEDYTKKTTELAEARKYVENFAADINTVLRNPTKFEEFKKVYPAEYVRYAEEILKFGKADSVPQGQTPDKARDPEIEAMKNDLQAWKKEKEEAELQSINSWLDTQFKTLSEKYPHAISEVITARAEAAARQGIEINQEVLDKLFKANDAEMKAIEEKRFKEKVNQQLKAGQKAKDMGSGGGIPGQAPKGPKTLREARDQMLQDLGA